MKIKTIFTKNEKLAQSVSIEDLTKFYIKKLKINGLSFYFQTQLS